MHRLACSVDPLGCGAWTQGKRCRQHRADKYPRTCIVRSFSCPHGVLTASPGFSPSRQRTAPGDSRLLYDR
eukprot:194588-Chlamydomonas_euryale.AAC.5